MCAWGFTYKSNIVWHKIRKDGGSDGRGMGFYFRNATEIILFGCEERMPARSRRHEGLVTAAAAVGQIRL
jgi:N6-adenosine-specific RNA methylase IME4